MARLTREEIARAEKRVREVLAEMQPFFHADGGDISLERITPDGIAKVRLHGACRDCSMSPMTLKAGVEEAIRRVLPRIKAVEAVGEVEPA
ncbi:MAG: NifU family protein [Flavobacteriales bacterium]|nr:NifU family protein [Flavobacteriales bacterium]MCB0794209.1 NifU family protein [Flavobacteriales bacterium]